MFIHASEIIPLVPVFHEVETYASASDHGCIELAEGYMANLVSVSWVVKGRKLFYEHINWCQSHIGNILGDLPEARAWPRSRASSSRSSSQRVVLLLALANRMSATNLQNSPGSNINEGRVIKEAPSLSPISEPIKLGLRFGFRSS